MSLKSGKKILETLSSVKLTLVCLGLMMVLVFWGTLAQAKMGTFAAQKLYFNQIWIYGPQWGPFKFPIFPGGLLVGGLWLINLSADFITRFKFHRKKIGIVLVHLGLILLVGGQGLTQLLAKESRLAFEEGQTKNFIERSFETELAFTPQSSPDGSVFFAIPVSALKPGKIIRQPHMPFEVEVKEFFPHAKLAMISDGYAPASSHGVGRKVGFTPLTPTTADNETNNNTAIIQLRHHQQDLGTWLVALNVGAPQSISVGGEEYRMSIRPTREYLPYSLHLKDFTHDVYQGTDIPKNFSSLVRLQNPETKEDRDVLIYMNHPLRYKGHTFYQASFGKDDTLSILQVVENPTWLAPYVACVVVAIGLLIQFISHLRRFQMRTQKEAA